MQSLDIVVVLDSVRSLFNVGAILRVADGMGVKKIITTGITPHPKQLLDTRLPHVIKRVELQLSKTALGAERTVEIKHYADPLQALTKLKEDGYSIVSLEINEVSSPLTNFVTANDKIALIVGNELTGVDGRLLALSDDILHIPMLGNKNSLNVATATAIALYHIRHISTGKKV